VGGGLPEAAAAEAEPVAAAGAVAAGASAVPAAPVAGTAPLPSAAGAPVPGAAGAAPAPPVAAAAARTIAFLFVPLGPEELYTYSFQLRPRHEKNIRYEFNKVPFWDRFWMERVSAGEGGAPRWPWQWAPSSAQTGPSPPP
jgi:hypothetical protein